MSAFLKFQLMEDLTMENIIALYSNYLRNPQNIDVNYQINFLISVNKYISTNLTLHVIADK